MTHEEYEAKKADLILQCEGHIATFRTAGEDLERLEIQRGALQNKINGLKQLRETSMAAQARTYDELYRLMTHDVWKTEKVPS